MAAEDRQDVEATLATFTDECYYRVPGLGVELRGKDQIRSWYEETFDEPVDVADFVATLGDTPPMFEPFRLRGLELANRVVVSPMDMYSSVDGTPGDFHLVHLGALVLPPIAPYDDIYRLVSAAWLHFDDLGVEKEFDTLVPHQIGDDISSVGLFTRKDLALVADQCYARAQACECLSQLATDRSGTDHCKPARTAACSLR